MADSKFREMKEILSRPDNRSKNSTCLLLEAAAQVGESVTFTNVEELALSNMKLYTYEVKVGHLIKCKGTGHINKKVAKANAAEQALEMVKNRADVIENSPGTSQVSPSHSADAAAAFRPAAGDSPNKACSPVSSLQEMCVKNKWALPSYDLVRETGRAHTKTFIYECKIESWGVTQGKGKTKKLAKKLAAGDMLALIREKTAAAHYQEDADGLSPRLKKPLEKKERILRFLVDPEVSEEAVPLEINLRGPLALEAYNKALSEGKACVKRVPVMLIGQDRSGKTSLKKSLMGKPFNPDEDSTVGIDVDPSHFKVSTEIWRAGENDQATHSVDAISFEHQAARLVAKHLKEEEPVEGVGVTSVHSGEIPLIDPKFDEHVPNVSSDDRCDPTQWSEKHSPLVLSKIPDKVATLIDKLLQEVVEMQDEEDIYSVLWDFGGQSVYYATHPLFMTAKAIYLLVYDLSRDPYAIAEPVVKQGRYKRILDNHGAKSNLDYLKFWLTSVASLASQDEDQHVRSDRVQVNIPPVFLVCTHADEPYGKPNPYALAREVFGSLQTTPYTNQLYRSVFVVDNRKSGTESECSEVIRLREKVLAVAKELPQMKEAIPIKWLKFEKALEKAVKEGQKWISLKMAKQIASEVCRIKDDQEFSTLLNFLHDQRILIHFDDTPMLNDVVVLDPQWLVDVFTKVTTVTPYDQDQDETEYEKLWRRLEETGIMDGKLLDHVWGPLFDQQETSASLLEIMEKFSLLCPWPSSDASCGRQYLVPSMLMWHPLQTIKELVASAQIPSFFLKFESEHVPPGLFLRLVLKFFQWGQNEFWSSVNPQLYQNFARFYTSGDEDCSVILLCHSSSIEVVVHGGNLSADLTKSLQPKLDISADTHCDAFEVYCARAMRRQLETMLECMRKEFCWLRNMKYKVGVMCPICCQGRLLSYCNTHHKQGCEQEECLHFWSVSDLRSTKEFVRCSKCATAKDNKVHVKQIAPWIETPGEQVAAIEKLLALPSKDLESLLSQPCDSKEVIVQLKDCLQSDQVSLEQLDPRTKRLISCLARKTKQSNRLDVFELLRKITPAGTTGIPAHGLKRKQEPPSSGTIVKQRKLATTGNNKKAIVVKKGSPSCDELEALSQSLGKSWQCLARRLNFEQGEIDGFHKDNEELAEKALKMLFEWKQKNGSNATYKALYCALCHQLCKRKELAEKFCCLSKKKT